MTTYPFTIDRRHLFVTLPDGEWLVDTGASQSMGRAASLTLAGRTVPLQASYLGADLDSLQDLVGRPFQGLIGQDLLLGFDIVFDAPGGQAFFDHDLDLRLTLREGARVDLSRTRGVPLIPGFVNGQRRLFWLDTGAQVAYYQRPDLDTFPWTGTVTDFFPTMGPFQVETRGLTVTLAGEPVTLNAGRLPARLGGMLTGVDGILGSDLFVGRRVGFFPLRGELVLGPVLRKAA